MDDDEREQKEGSADGVLVVVHRNGTGATVDVQVVGDVRLTEIDTLLAMGRARAREVMGLDG